MHNNTFEIPGVSYEAFCASANIETAVPLENTSENSIMTVVNLTGFFIRLIDKALPSMLDGIKFSVKPAYNKDDNEDLGDPVITVARTTIAIPGLSMMGNKSEIQNTDGLNDDVNLLDSFSVSDMFDVEFSISIYAKSLAESAKIQEAIFGIMFASSYTTLSEIFSNIKYVMPPIASPIGLEERGMELYTGQVTFTVKFMNSANILMKKNLIEVARIAVREEEEENVIWRRDEQID